jgi:hypothetical protein
VRDAVVERRGQSDPELEVEWRGDVGGEPLADRLPDGAPDELSEDRAPRHR